MKATTQTPNTLFLAVWSKAGKCIVLGNFRNETGMEPEIEEMGPLVEWKGEDPFALLAKTLADVKALCARHIVIFTNDAKLAEVFTFPVRLEPTSPTRTHLTVPAQWDILRAFCLYDSWQCKHAEKLPKAQQLWEETYGKRN
jgi:hypothetical protein